MQQDRTAHGALTPHPGDNVTQVTTRVLGRFSAGHPRGSKPAEEFAAAQTAAGTPATVVMNLAADEFIVKAVQA